MSEAISVLAGESVDGFCSVRDTGLRGMITIRADLDDATVKTAIKSETGIAVPEQGAITIKGDTALAWMSPDELLLFCAYDSAVGVAGGLSKALAKTHALVANVSDARAVFRVEGEGAREVMAKLSPADVAPGAFAPGQMRRTRIAQVPAGFFMPDDTSFEVIMFRSVARYAFDLLVNASRNGSEVGIFSARG